MVSPTPVSEIPTLTDLYQVDYLLPSSHPYPTATSKHNTKISLIRTDITHLATDVIVNAANTSLLGGGGVDGAIHSAAGPDLLEECRSLEGCDTGDAKITDAYDLPCKKVIHAVGPVYWSAKKEGRHAELLGGCYRRSLDLVVESGCRSVAFSALSTGVYGYPSEEAAEVAIRTVKGWLEGDEERSGKMERVVFCSFLEKDERAYRKHIPRFFSPATTGEAATGADTGSRNTAGAENEAPAATTTSKTDEAVETKTEETSELPDLPDVPTKEPTEPGQPEAKKTKLDIEADDKEKP